MALLNNHAYTVDKDRLVYDATHPIDGGAVPVTLSVEKGGVIRRGTLLDFEAESGEYKLHEAKGKPVCIAAQDTEYGAEDPAVLVPVYISGTFRESEVISSGLTDADREELRKSGIFLK